MSLTTRMFLLVVVAVLPAIGIQAYNEYDLRAARAEDIRQQVVQITKQFGEEMGELREGARQLLVALGQLPAVKRQQGEACDGLLASTKQNFSNYGLLAAADANGHIFCSSGKLAYSSVADQPFFRRAMASDGLAVGNYWMDPATGQKMIHFAQRFHDSDGQVAGVVFAGLDLDWLSQHLKERGLSPTASILIADREGNIIARLPHPEALVGKNMRKSHEAIMDGDKTGWEEAKGVDGIVRIFGYLPAQLPPYDLFLSAGLSKAEAFAPIDAASMRGISLIMLGLLLALYAAYQGGRIFIRRPIAGLLRAAEEWSNGNYEARAQLDDTGSEIGRLGTAFNKMAAAVSARYAAQQRAEKELRQLNMTLEDRVERRTMELANANRELATARDEAESANNAKTAFLAAMSHELRTPLNAIVGFSEMVAQQVYGPVHPKYAEFSGSILSAGQRMSAVVGDVLTIAQLEAGTFELDWNEVDLAGVARETMEKLRREEAGRGADFVFAAAIEHIPVLADIRSVEQMIAKLLSNAVKFSGPGTPVTLTVGIEADGAAWLSVRDKGIGMTTAEADAAIRPFRQVDERMERKYQGSGLGLSIVNKLIESHHGRLTIASSSGEGTEVSLFFPPAAKQSNSVARLVAA
ncbi:MAG TPA: ATP-binding protein [Stellaceae bacterium]|jgi:signal transduction histidine kinase|nr:ATP-binding protein [Stellaceae bacterium]